MKTASIALIFAASALVQLGVAQEASSPESFRGMVRLNRAPVSNEVLKVKLPRPVEKRLSNGIKLLILEDHRAPTISLTIQIPASELRDPEDDMYLTSATASLIRLGTTTRD